MQDGLGASVSGTGQWVSFRLQKQLFLLDIAEVKEITTEREVAPVPLAPEFIAGLVNLRGRIVTAVHLHNLLTGCAPQLNPGMMHLIVQAGSEVVSVLVDDVGDVVSLPPQAIEPVPPNLRGYRQEFLRGVGRWNGHLALVLNAASIVNFCIGIRESETLPKFN